MENEALAARQFKTVRKVTHLIFTFAEKQPEKPKITTTKPKEKMVLGVPMSEIEKVARIGESYEDAAVRINTKKAREPKTQPVHIVSTLPSIQAPKTPAVMTDKERENTRLDVIKALVTNKKPELLKEFLAKGFVTSRAFGNILEPDLKLAGLFD